MMDLQANEWLMKDDISSVLGLMTVLSSIAQFDLDFPIAVDILLCCAALKPNTNANT